MPEPYTLRPVQVAARLDVNISTVYAMLVCAEWHNLRSSLAIAAVAPQIARAGITGFRVHDWRHDYATRFLSAGGDVRSLMQIMGWSSPRMVQRYVSYRDDQIAAIVARVA